MNGTYQHHFPMTLDETYSNWFTPVNDFSVSTATIRQVESNLFYIYITGEFSTNAIAANGDTSIGSLTLSYFGNKPVTGYVPAVVRPLASSAFHLAIALFSTAGGISIRGATAAAGQVYVNGLVTRREV